jgi:hypothetical protein
VRITRSILAAAVSIATVGAIAAPLAHADDGQSRVDVTVGKSIEIDVGYMRGLLCDDLSIISADLRNKSETTNVLAITGLKEGTTLCRVGQQGAAFHLYEIHVTAPKHR